MKRKLRILFVVGGVPWQKDFGGGYIIAFETARHLASRGLSVDILTAAPRTIQRDVGWAKITYVNKTRLSVFPLLQYAKINLRSRSYDIIHAHGGEAICFGLQRKLFRGPPLVVGAYIADARRPEVMRMRPWNLYERISLKTADRVCVLSHFSRENIAGAFQIHPESIEVVYPGVRDDFFEYSQMHVHTNDDPEFVRLLFVGRLDEQKGLDILLEAIPLIASHAKVRLSVVGVGRKYSLYEALVERLNISDIVLFEGSVPHDEMPSVYARSDIFVLPSRAESFGLVIAEAMAVGLPVVSTNVGAIPEVVSPGVTGLLVPPEDPESLASALSFLINNPQVRRQMGAAGRLRAQQHFTWHETAARVEKMYRRLLGG